MFPGQIGAWTVLVPGVFADALASARWRRDGVFDPVRFLASGSLLVLAFLSCSSGKLPKYLILVAPWYALLAGEVAARLGRGGGAARLLGTGAALTALAAALVAGGLVLPF